MANLRNVIYISNEDYTTLVEQGTVTINGTTLTYSENDVYITPEVPATTTENGLMSSADKTKLDSIATQTAYTSKGTATKVPQITTNTYGQVTSITEVAITQPTKTSDLTNDSNFVTGSSLTSGKIVVGGGNSTVGVSTYTVNDLKAIAEGASSTYAIATKSCITGTEDSQTGNFSGVTQILTTPNDNSTAIDLSKLKVGSNIYIAATDVPDYWVSSVSTVNNVTTVSLNVLETNKVDLTNYAPKAHASSATTYGVGTTSNYGHVKLKTGDMVALDYEDGVAASISHSHSDYYPAANPNGYTSNTGTVTGVTAGVGLNTTSNDTGTDGGTISTSGTIHLTKSGVTAGTYQGITVDKYGRVTSASDQAYGSYSKPSGGIPDSDLAEDYLKLDGTTTMTGALQLKATGNNETNIGTNGIRWNTNSLPQDTAPQYFCTIDAFASGGRQKWASLANVKTALGVPSNYVSSVNGSTGAITNVAKTDVANTFTEGQKITRTTSGAILELESAASDTNFLLKRTSGATCVLESGSTVGLFGTKSNHALQIRTNYTNRMTFDTSGGVTLATDVPANSDSNQLATTKWVNAKGYTSNVGTVTSVNNTNPDANGNVSLTIPSAVTESTVSGWGFTKNTGTVTSVNGVEPVNGNVTLTIASEVTESTVSGWGFTKNAGTVTSVAAGTGLNISGTATVNPTVNVDSNYKLQTTQEWKNSSIYSIVSGITTTAGNASSGSYLSVKWTVDDVEGITEPYDGMKILVRVPLAGVGTAGVVLSIDGGTTYHPVAYNVNTALTTHYPVNTNKVFVYNATQKMNGYLTSNTATNITGVWQGESNYDSNTTITYGTLAYYFRPYAAQAVYRYKLGMLDKDNRFVPLTTTNLSQTAYSDYASSTTYAKDVIVHRSGKWYKSLAASNKGHTPESNATWWTEVADCTPTSLSFKPDKIYWYNTTTTISAGAVMGGNTLMTVGYNQPYMAYCNFNEGMLAYRVIYLCGTYNTTTGLFTLRDGGTAGSKLYYTTVPTNTANLTLSTYFTSGYDYILVGGTYSSNNYLHLREDHPMYHFDGTNLVPYDTWHAEQSGMNNPMTTQGDIIYGGSSGTPTRLAKGTAGQVLTMNSGATAPEWTTPSVSVDMCISKTYSELKTMRDNSTLVPGQTYRITDYTVAYVASNKNVIAAAKSFDILVVADAADKLNENARATLHSGDTYFANSKLEAWQLKYCIDNDTNRFNWAHSSGKGVIWYLKDEFNNSCYYDFKGIYILDTASNTAFTFGDTSDDYSLYKRTSICYNNTIEPYYNSSGVLQIGRNHIGKSSYNIHLCKGCYNNLIGEGCHDIYFDTGCYSNTIANYSYKIKFGANCYSNSFNGTSNYDVTLGTSCYSNTAASMVYCINLDNYCQSNALGQYMSYSTFGEYCSGNSFGSSCSYITLGMYSYYNAFGNSCQDIILSSYCRSNTFGNYFYHIYLGNDCSYNKLGQGTTTNNTYDYQQNIMFDNGVQYLDFKGATSGSSNAYIKNVKVHMGVHGASTSNRKTISATRNLDYSVDYLAAGSKEVILDA